jgi:hypothetical protein
MHEHDGLQALAFARSTCSISCPVIVVAVFVTGVFDVVEVLM